MVRTQQSSRCKYGVTFEGEIYGTNDIDLVLAMMSAGMAATIWVSKSLETIPGKVVHIGDGMHIEIGGSSCR